MNTMNTPFPYQVIMLGDRRYTRHWNIAKHIGKPAGVITRLIDQGQIAVHLINAQVYIDVDEALEVLAKITVKKRVVNKRLKVVVEPEKVDSFSVKVA
jgi:hypothetical protein